MNDCPVCAARRKKAETEATAAEVILRNRDRSIAHTKERAKRAKETNTCYDCGKSLSGGSSYERNAAWGYYARFCEECDGLRTEEAYAKGWI